MVRIKGGIGLYIYLDKPRITLTPGINIFNRRIIIVLAEKINFGF